MVGSRKATLLRDMVTPRLPFFSKGAFIMYCLIFPCSTSGPRYFSFLTLGTRGDNELWDQRLKIRQDFQVSESEFTQLTPTSTHHTGGCWGGCKAKPVLLSFLNLKKRNHQVHQVGVVYSGSADLASAIDPWRPVAKFAEVCDLPPGGEAGGAQHLEEGGRGRGVGAAVGGGGGRQGGQRQVCLRKWSWVIPDHLKNITWHITWNVSTE